MVWFARGESQVWRNTPNVNSELLYEIGMEKCNQKSILNALKENSHFKDGTKEDFDAVIACTGFVLAHPFFDKKFYRLQ